MNQHPNRALCLWPGLAGLWLRGQWNSLILAAGFSLLLNLALAGTFIWPELFGPRFSVFAWPILAITWSLSFWISWKTLDRLVEPSRLAGPADDTLFIQAQTEYLKGDWELCERLLVQRLTDQPRDLESRLLMASTLRRTGQQDAARQQLVTMKRIDGWQSWHTEVANELSRLDVEDTEQDVQEIDESISENADAGEQDVASDRPSTPQTGFVRLGQALQLTETESPAGELADNQPTQTPVQSTTPNSQTEEAA